jgi:penicillin-binding protein 1B
MRLRINRGFLLSGLGLAFFATIVGLLLIGAGVFTYYWITYSRMIDQRLAGRMYQTSARVYSSPDLVFDGETLSPADLVSQLQHDGYNETKVDGAPGWYAIDGNVVEIHPLRDSYFEGKNALHINFAGGGVSSIKLLDNGNIVESAEIEPELLTNLFDTAREKRRRIRFDDIPKVLLNAVLSAEDKRFFEHPGLDMVRVFGAAWADVRHQGIAQGASTLTMQLSRSFFFTTERTWRRKVAETMVSLELEHRFTKQQIFELYANEIYLGNRGSFAIHGFAEGSLAYFNKDIRDISVGEAAFLAGIIRAPNRYSTADRRPERAAEARDRVLNQLLENGFIKPEQLQEAKRAPLGLVSGGQNNSDAPYFVDMVKDHLLDRFSEAELLSQSYRIYTTLDPQLERAAVEAASLGIANVDQLLARKYARWKKAGQPAEAQVAMVVLDPRNGNILAIVGGRNYGQSQLNHVTARRQPGSVFKPFVYAAAFDSAVKGLTPLVTPATTVVDEPTTFDFEGKEYTPNNYGENFHGTVSLRDALAFSLNVATVKVAEMVGYGRVVDMARQLGLDDDIQPTPAVALGAYDMTPLEVAAGYTVFANSGTRAEPVLIDRVIDYQGGVIERSPIQTRKALDPRVAYQITTLLEDVIDHGTGASVRARGFMGPAAGKTGTSRDGWFAGYTSNLLCVVWVGFDDYRELGLSGAVSAAPVWAEFMKRATALPAYSKLNDFPAPPGVSLVDIDPTTMQLATPACPTTRKEVFLAGTEPTEFCELHGGRMLTQTPPPSWLSRIFGGGRAKDDDAPPPGAENGNASNPAIPGLPTARTAPPGTGPVPVAASPDEDEKKAGLLHKIFGIFGGKKPDQDTPKEKTPDPQR